MDCRITIVLKLNFLIHHLTIIEILPLIFHYICNEMIRGKRVKAQRSLYHGLQHVRLNTCIRCGQCLSAIVQLNNKNTSASSSVTERPGYHDKYECTLRCFSHAWLTSMLLLQATPNGLSNGGWSACRGPVQLSLTHLLYGVQCYRINMQ